jgi:hypothetical protein
MEMHRFVLSLSRLNMRNEINEASIKFSLTSAFAGSFPMEFKAESHQDSV